MTYLVFRLPIPAILILMKQVVLVTIYSPNSQSATPDDQRILDPAKLVFSRTGITPGKSVGLIPRPPFLCIQTPMADSPTL